MESKCKKLVPEQLPAGDNEGERFDAFNLIRTGNRSADKLTRRVGQA